MSMSIITRYILFFVVNTLLYGDTITWFGNFDKAHQEALQSNKPMLVLLVKKDLPLCNRVLRESFTQREYIAYINKHYVSVILYANQIESYPIEMLYTQVYPSLFLLDKHEIFIKEPLYGYFTYEDVKKFILK